MSNNNRFHSNNILVTEATQLKLFKKNYSLFAEFTCLKKLLGKVVCDSYLSDIFVDKKVRYFFIVFKYICFND